MLNLQKFVARVDTAKRRAITENGKYPWAPLWRSRQYWTELIWWITADAAAHANTTAEGIIVPNITIPANYMADGRSLQVILAGRLSNTASATMIWATRWGGVSGTLLATTEAINPGSAVTNIAWRIVMEIITRVNGAAGSLFVMGELGISLTASTFLGQVYGVSGFDAPAAVTVDLTADTALSQTGDWSAASVSNTLTAHKHYGISLN